MTTMTEKTARVAEAQAKLIDQFKAHVNIDAIVKAFVTQSQELEVASFDVIENTLISTAIGLQLDNLGDVVGVERQGRNDADYRVRIGAQISLNNANGTIEEILELIVALGGGDIDLEEIFPAKIGIQINDAVSNGTEIANVVSLAKAAGVGVNIIWHESLIPFRFGVAGQGFDQGELGQSAVF